jgi:hydroxymethylpyrimidine/phosphomethylpyrimidine kinase
MTPRILIIAGSDSGGGAGIQGDLKTVTSLGGYGATAITALTAQNTQGVFGVHPVPPAFLAQQIGLVLDDIGADAIKTGMLHSAEIIDTVVTAIGGFSGPVVVDPVMVAKGGSALLEADAMDALRHRLIPRATLLTPNLPEASLLIGQPIATLADMEAAVPALRALGARNLLLKGGHLAGDAITDLLITPSDTVRFSSTRIATPHTHGTGCTLASAIATFLGAGLALEEAVAKARGYVHQAILHAPGFGKGHGPLMHHFRQ